MPLVPMKCSCRSLDSASAALSTCLAGSIQQPLVVFSPGVMCGAFRSRTLDVPERALWPRRHPPRAQHAQQQLLRPDDGQSDRRSLLARQYQDPERLASEPLNHALNDRTTPRITCHPAIPENSTLPPSAGTTVAFAQFRRPAGHALQGRPLPSPRTKARFRAAARPACRATSTTGSPPRRNHR